jgi:hypothetical protein
VIDEEVLRREVEQQEHHRRQERDGNRGDQPPVGRSVPGESCHALLSVP